MSCSSLCLTCARGRHRVATEPAQPASHEVGGRRCAERRLITPVKGGLMLPARRPRPASAAPNPRIAVGTPLRPSRTAAAPMRPSTAIDWRDSGALSPCASGSTRGVSVSGTARRGGNRREIAALVGLRGSDHAGTAVPSEVAAALLAVAIAVLFLGMVGKAAAETTTRNAGSAFTRGAFATPAQNGISLVTVTRATDPVSRWPGEGNATDAIGQNNGVLHGG